MIDKCPHCGYVKLDENYKQIGNRKGKINAGKDY